MAGFECLSIEFLDVVSFLLKTLHFQGFLFLFKT